jgi:TatD DNase family protein
LSLAGIWPTPAELPPITGLTDTHCHLNLAAFAGDLESVLDRAARAGLVRMLVPGIDPESSRRAAELAAKQPMLSFAAGVHPHETESFTPETLQAIRKVAEENGAAAIGEIGLDYYRDLAPRACQREAFRAQIDLAMELRLPVIIHIREAADDALAILAESGPELRGVWHAFSGELAEAERALELGLHLGAAGPVTYPKAGALREILLMASPDRILLETDAPYLPPQGFRGKRNEPARVNLIARRLADDRGIDPELWAAQTRANAQNLFHWE